ncbi:RNA polymerase subunit sigma-24 [Frankia sp. AiPs1]|uniref:RNA polymerase subunit sigma-24 n=1 Tax=Frankia sp. AiPa1 TaxID=573492 RepID=UPI00202B8305|nr:RNA polymerase subunit sigma-24 [Frankia sp. AiPa1]MCL9760777.1 RNA polymerase subunit sigma-24 [Frankia sp. AiPa1]
MDDDADLVARVRRGDRLAFDDLYDLYADDVFSMCLLILGDPTVARAAAGTAFALVARTRLNPLTNPAGLRSWLLELARGSALAWSGSPQARSIPVPHGVPPEDLLVGAVVPAPASLRVGLARTFDRAATVAEAAATRRIAEASSFLRAAQPPASPAARSVPGSASNEGSLPGDARPGESEEPSAAVTSPRTPKPGGEVRSASEPEPDDAARTHVAPAPVRALPLMRFDADGDAGPTAGARATQWRTRPAMAAAAVLAVAALGLTAAMNWPANKPQMMSESGISLVSPSPPAAYARPSVAPAAPSSRALSGASAPTPTVAGAYTSRAHAPANRVPRIVEPVARDIRRTPHLDQPAGGTAHSVAAGGQGGPDVSSPPPDVHTVRSPTTTKPATSAPTATDPGGTPITPTILPSATPPTAPAPPPTPGGGGTAATGGGTPPSAGSPTTPDTTTSAPRPSGTPAQPGGSSPSGGISAPPTSPSSGTTPGAGTGAQSPQSGGAGSSGIRSSGSTSAPGGGSGTGSGSGSGARTGGSGGETTAPADLVPVQSTILV